MKINIIRKSDRKIVELRKGLTEGNFVIEKNNEIRVSFKTRGDRWDFNDYSIDDYFFKEVR